MSTVTTKWIMELADRVSAPVRNLAGKVTSATQAGERMNRIYSRAENVLRKLGSAALQASSKMLLMKQSIIDAASEIPGIDYALRMLKNPALIPVALGAGLAYATKKAYDFKKGMSEINATTQMSQDSLNDLQKNLMVIGKDSGGNFERIPKSFEAINSTLDDANISLDVLKTAVDGSKAGFTDLDVVGDALAKTMSIIGKENVKAKDVLDTFLQAKTIGAGEFQDFANYMPGLIASGKSLGIQYQDVAGIFSFMTTKAADASEAAMLISNAFTALGKSDVREKLAKTLGISLFDKEGITRNFGDVINEMASKFAGMSDKERALTIESAGFTDAQAKTALMSLLSDASGLKKMMEETNNSFGATQKALDATVDPSRRWSEVLDKISYYLVIIGDKVLPILDLGLRGLISIFNWFEKPVVQSALQGIANAFIILYKVLKWPTIAVIALSAAFAALNFVFSISPLGWLVIAFVAVVTALTIAWERVEKFRGAILGIWEVIKGFGSMLKEFVLDNIKRLLDGIGGLASAIGKLFRGDFKGAFADAKDSVMNLASLNPMAVAYRGYKGVYEQGKKSGELFNKGMMEGVAQVATKKLEEKGSFSLLNNASVDANNLGGEKDETKDKSSGMNNMSVDNKSSGSGSGGGKTITMSLDFKQYFTLGKDQSGDVIKIANQVVEIITDKLRDGLIAVE